MTQLVQKLSFNANYITRGSAARVLILPLVPALAASRFGMPSKGVLNRLKASERNPNRRCSLKGELRGTPKSRVVKEGAVRVFDPLERGAKGGGTTKRARLTHSSMVC